MFTLASPANIIISMLVFFITARYLRYYLEQQGLPKGLTRGTLIFSLAFLMSWASGELVDWLQGKPAVQQSAGDLSQRLKPVDQSQPAITE